MMNGKNFTQLMRVFKLAFIGLLFILPFSGMAQYDYEHYVPPFYNGSSTNRDIGYHQAILSTNSVKDVTVSIYKGYSELLGTVVIKQGTPAHFDLPIPGNTSGGKGFITSYPDNYSFPWNVVGAKELNAVLPNKGLRFYSSDGPFFVNMRHSTDDQGGSLTTKGTYAYGKEFLSGHLYTHQNSATNRRSHFISVMATEDNTEVNFTDIKVSRLTKYNSTTKSLESMTVSPADIITANLMRGESYIIAVDHDLSGFSTADMNAMNGTSVTATKPIVMNTGSWTSGASGQDIGVDQIVPIDQIRNEYIIMRGKGNSTTERVILVATEDNTQVSVNGSDKGTIAKKGETMILTEPYNGDGNAYVLSNKNIYVYQTLSGSSSIIGPTVGMNFIPPVSTSGIREVTVPYAEKLAERGVNGVITILVQTNAVISYSRNGEATLHPISDISGTPKTIPDVPQWQIYKLTSNLTGSYRFYSNKAINVAWLVESQYVGAAGYYSGFTKSISKIPTDINLNVPGELKFICESYDENISVSLSEPLPDFYEWYVNDLTGDPIIENGPLVVEAPDVETSYHVVGYFRDPLADQLFNGTFSEHTVNSDYTEVYGNLRKPGEYCTVRQTIDADPSFKNPTFTDMDNDFMFMAISKDFGDTIYRGTSVDVVDGFKYIIKVFGRSVVNSTYTEPQSLKVLVNDEIIVDNFKIDDVNNWQSVSALWKPGTAESGVIKLVNNNASGVKAAFAIDSITFVQAKDTTAEFVAKVVPNYSYGSDGDEVHFCKGVPNSLDVSNGDTSWYDYSWSKDSVELVNGAEFDGVKSHELIFLDPQKSQEGDYICNIAFKPEYQQCGTSGSTVDVNLKVFVDEAATVSIDADQTSFCSGGAATLNALVTGDAGGVKWYVNGGTSPVSVDNPFTFNYPTGTYTVRCEAENGCGLAFDEVEINVLSTPELLSITSNDNLCVGEDIIVTAQATGDGTLVYTWKRNSDILSETGNVLNYPATILDRESTFKVKVKSVYTIAGNTVECVNGSGKAVFDLNVIPLVEFDKLLANDTVCEGENHSFDVTMKYPGNFYTYSWTKDGASITGNLSSLNLSSVSVSDGGTYKVDVTNQCNSEYSEADLIVTPKIKVNGFSLDKTGPFCVATTVTASFNVDNTGAVYIYQVKEPDGTSKTITNPYSFTLDASNQGDWEFLVSSSCDAPVSFTRSLNMHSNIGTLSVADVGTCIGQTVNFEAKLSSIPPTSTLVYEWFDPLGASIGTNSDLLEIKNVQDVNLGTYSVKVTDQCGNVKNASANLTKESVDASTVSDVVCEGDNYSTTISYLGSPTFEWRFNDPINGTIVGTTETLSLTGVSLAQAGDYYCNVTLICGTYVVRRNLKVNAHVSLVGPTTETVHVCVGEKALLDVTVIGNIADYTIEWTDFPGTSLGVGSSIQLDPHLFPGTFTYYAKVHGLCEDPVKTFTIEVHDKPTLSTVDNSIIECSGLISLDVLVSGSDHNGIVWWKDGAIITDGNAVSTNFVLNPATSPSDDGDYIAKMETDYCGDAQVTINLDVRNTIVVTAKSPATTVVCENDATNLFVTATGDDIKYKWYKSTASTTILSDKSNLDLGNILFAQAGEYKCELSNDLNCGNQTLTFDVQVGKHATVTNPASVVMCETDPNPVFTVTGTGEAPLSYQWYDKNDNAVAGGTGSSLTVTSPVNGQTYYCIVSGNSCKSATSAKATLTIIKNVSVTDPSDLTISDGANASFTVVASGEPNYTYQWQENAGSGWNNLSNGGKYSGTDQATLYITGADKLTFDGNQYRCVVDSDGAICTLDDTSNPATLTISEVTKIAVQATGTTVCSNTNASISVEGTTAGLSYTWYYKKGAGAYETADGKDGITTGEIGLVSTLTIPANNLAINNWKFQCVVSDGVSADQTSNEVVINVLEDISVATADATYNSCVGQAFSMSVSATGDAIKYKWYKVGAESTILSTSASYNMGTISAVKAGAYKCEVYNDLACNDEVRTFVVNVKALPTVSGPADFTMCVTDADPDFTVVAGGDGPFTYQWYDNAGSIAGATSATYTETSPVDGKYYYCEVTNSCTTVASNKANLVVVEELAVTNPSNLTIADGANAEFSVVASGEPNYSYQWEENNGVSSTWNSLSNGGKYSGVDTDKLMIAGADRATYNGYKYRCIVTTSGTVCIPSVISGEATLIINLVDKILNQPNNDRVCLNDNASISVEGKELGMSYLWEYDANDGNGFVGILPSMTISLDATGFISTLTVLADNLNINNWKFRCSVNALPTVLIPAPTAEVSSPATIKVLDNIVVTPGTVNFSLCEKEALLMSVSATGGDLQYKWYKDSNPTITLSTASSLGISEVLSGDAGAYTCEIFNDINCNNQVENFTVGVKLHPTVTDPSDKDVCASETNVEFEVTATGDAPLTYQWYDGSNNPVAEVTATSDKLVVVTPVDGQSYYCVVTNSCSSSTSAIATLTVYEEVSIVDNPIDATIPDGGNATFTVKVAGEPTYTYQWQVKNGATWDDLSDGVHYAGTQSKTLQVLNADQLTFDGKQYRCVAGNIKCSADATSNLATLTITSVVKIAAQPNDIVVCLASPTELEIVGTTTGLNYTWEYDDGSGFANANGVLGMSSVTTANGSKLTFTASTLAMKTWTFRCIVDDTVSATETSNVVSMTVVEPVNFDALIDENLCFGVEKQISLANISGTEPISFSWMKGASEVSTTANVSIGASDNGTYTITAGNGGICPDSIASIDVYHYDELAIAAWSNSALVCIGDTEVLSVGITAIDAAKTASYKWFKDGAPIGTNASFSLLATNKNQSGQYKVEVTDGCSTETVFGYVDVYEPIVASNTWNTETTLCVGDELKLETKVTGDITSYVWTKDGIGFTANSTYLKSAVVTGDAGAYVCKVYDNCANLIEYTIKVNVLDVPAITTGIDGITAVCEGDALVLGPISVTGTYDDLIWTLNDNSTNSTAGTSLDLGTADVSEAGNYLVTVSNICGSDVSLGKQVVNPLLSIDPIPSQTVCAGNDVVFRANATGTSLNYQWLVDGVDKLVNSSELVIDASEVLPFDLNTSKTYNVVCNITSTTGCGGLKTQATTLTVDPNTVLHATLKNVVKYVGESYSMTVDVSGVGLSFEWTHELTDGTKVPMSETGATVVLTNISMADAGYYTCKIIGTCGQRLASGKLTVKEPVTIVSGLNALEEKCVGDPLSLSIVASGQISSIQWLKNDVNIPGATSLNLFIAAVDLTDAAVYKCKIIGEGVSGGLIEQTTVRVYSQTVLNASLKDTTLCEGNVMDWIPDVDGTSNMTFEWTLDGVNVSNQKILHYDALALSDEGNYEVQVTSMCGDVSSSANLEVIQLPVFVSATKDTVVCENTPLVEFTVDYTGEKLKYQWRKDGLTIPGRTSQTLSLTNIQLSDDGDYDCRVYSDCGEEFSPVATLIVTAQLQVLSDMVDMEVCTGEDVLFTADVVGNNVTYQWKVDGVDVVDVPGVISGANTSELSIVSSQTFHSGYYTCILSDDCTDYRSTKPTELIVNALPNTAIYGRMILCAKEDRVTYLLNQVNSDVYSWDVAGGIFAGPEEGIKTRITWEETTSGSLSVTMMDLVTGCSSKIDSAVVLNALPTVNLTSMGSKGVCEEEFELTGGYPEGGIYWVNGISQTEFNPFDRGAGTYAVHYSYTDENGCSNVTPTTNLNVDILPVVDITDDLTVGSCIPTPLTASTGEDNIQWFKIQDNNRVLPDNLDNPNSMNPIFTPGKSQVLMALVKDEHGCEGVDLLNLSVAPLPVVTTINDTTVGQCNQLVLQTDIVGDQDVISWTNADHLDHADERSPMIIDAPAGTHTYTINVSDLYGCDATGNVTVTMVADPTLPEDKFGCEGDQYEINMAGMENPVWDDGDSSPVRTIETPGKYLLEVSNEYGCNDEQLFVINPKPKFDLEDNLICEGQKLIPFKDKPVTIFEGQTVTLGPNLPSYYAPYFFEWQDGSILQEFEVSETGTYKLQVKDNLGCIAIDSVDVFVKTVGIETPNAFLPTSGGENNRFSLEQYRLDERGVIQDFEMYVYDRWGELLYKTDSVEKNAGWDGKYKGEYCPAGAYVWVVFINGELTDKGTFMLIR